MPTLEFLSLQEEQDKYPPITRYGYQSDFFQEINDLFTELEKEDPQVDVDDGDKIAARLLRTGPCPGNARVYHQFTSTPEIGGGEETVSELLSEELETSRREAGQTFENWVDKANKALNDCLQSNSLDSLQSADIPDELANFYTERISEIESKADEINVEPENLQMDVQLEVFTPYFHESTPDGAWLPDNQLTGGVFESKLSLPPAPVHRYQLAGYAAHIERSEEMAIDFGIFLYIEDNELKLDSFYIDDVLRESIKENLEIFSSLAFQSIAEGEWDENEPLSNRLVEPSEPRYESVCQDCPYLHACHHEGKYEQLITEIYNTISNLKLGGNQLLDALSAVKKGEPKRTDVVTEVMENFPQKSPKSVFRGMVTPTTQRLQLVRVQHEGNRVSLSPNGRIIMSNENNRKERLTTIIRDFVICELGLTKNAINYLTNNLSQIPDRVREMDGTESTCSNLEENFPRFLSHYLNHFEFTIPNEGDLRRGNLEYLYKESQVIDYLLNESNRKDLIHDSLPTNQQVQIEKARLRLMKKLLQSGRCVSTWFVDEVLWQEWRSEESCINLWQGSVHDNTKLIKEGTPYDGVLLNQ